MPVWGASGEPAGWTWAHGAEFDRTGSDVTSAVWTSPAAGEVTISGVICEGAHWFRWMRWEIWHAGTLLTGGDICSDGTYTTDHPWNFAAGSGGPGALVCPVLPDEQIELRLTSLGEGGNLGESLLMQLHISLREPTSAPLPAATTVRLLPPAPNPFNPRTTLSAEITHEGPVCLAVFDLTGKLVRTLLDAPSVAPGRLVVDWNGCDDAGRACPSGQYVARLSSAEGVGAVGMTLAR